MRYRVPPDLRFRRVLDEGVVLRQEAGEVLGFNDVAQRILELAAAGHEEEEIKVQLLEEFEVEARQLERDLGPFLRELLTLGVLQPEPS